MLLTSRERLRLASERAWPVPPLSDTMAGVVPRTGWPPAPVHEFRSPHRAVCAPGRAAARDRTRGRTDDPLHTRTAPWPSRGAPRPAQGTARHRSTPADAAGDDRLVTTSSTSPSAAYSSASRSSSAARHTKRPRRWPGDARRAPGDQRQEPGAAARGPERSPLPDAGHDPRIRRRTTRGRRGRRRDARDPCPLVCRAGGDGRRTRAPSRQPEWLRLLDDELANMRARPGRGVLAARRRHGRRGSCSASGIAGTSTVSGTRRRSAADGLGLRWIAIASNQPTRFAGVSVATSEILRFAGDTPNAPRALRLSWRRSRGNTPTNPVDGLPPSLLASTPLPDLSEHRPP